MIRISSIGLSFTVLSAIRAERRLAAFHWDRWSRLWNGGRVKKSVIHRSGRKLRLAMRDSTMSIYTHRSGDPYCRSRGKA